MIKNNILIYLFMIFSTLFSYCKNNENKRCMPKKHKSNDIYFKKNRKIYYYEKQAKAKKEEFLLNCDLFDCCINEPCHKCSRQFECATQIAPPFWTWPGGSPYWGWAPYSPYLAWGGYQTIINPDGCITRSPVKN